MTSAVLSMYTLELTACRTFVGSLIVSSPIFLFLSLLSLLSLSLSLSLSFFSLFFVTELVLF